MNYNHSHRVYIKAMYKRAIQNTQSFNMNTTRNEYSRDVAAIRAKFDAARDLTDPRAIAAWIRDQENWINMTYNFDPIIYPKMPGGQLFERNTPPPQWTEDDWNDTETYMHDVMNNERNLVVDDKAYQSSWKEWLEAQEKMEANERKYWSDHWHAVEAKEKAVADRIKRGGSG